MVDLSRYTLAGTYVFENIQNQLGSPFPTINIGTCAKSYELYLKLIETNINGRIVLYQCLCNINEPTIRIRYYFNVLKADGSSTFTKDDVVDLEPSYGTRGHPMNVDELLNDGFLVNGGLIVEYGFHVEAVLDQDGIWNLNIADPFFDGNNCIVDARDYQNDIFYCHKQIMNFHFNCDTVTFHDDYNLAVEQLLQIAHGVRKQAVLHERIPLLTVILNYALEHNLFNVARQIEIQFIHSKLIYTEWALMVAISSSQRCLLAEYLRNAERREIISDLQDFDLEMMSGETMKQFTMFLFDIQN